MIDETASESDQQAESASPGPVGGERLAEARRAQQISVFEIAKELHIDEPKVRALERNDFEILGAPVFAKGYLRKYAKLVGVDEDDVIADYYRMTRSDSMPPVIGGRRKHYRELSPGPWIAVIVAVLVALAAYWWLTNRPVTIDRASSDPVEPDATVRSEIDDSDVDDTLVLEGPAADAEPEEPAAPDVSEQNVPATADVVRDEAEPAESEAPAESEGPAIAGQIRLALSFSGDCWTEITDANGRRLFFGMGQDGRNVELIGAAPISALFGDADNVTVWVDGQDYAMTAADRRGRTARLQIGSP